jgi:hypothetical protein
MYLKWPKNGQPFGELWLLDATCKVNLILLLDGVCASTEPLVQDAREQDFQELT